MIEKEKEIKTLSFGIYMLQYINPCTLGHISAITTEQYSVFNCMTFPRLLQGQS